MTALLVITIYLMCNSCLQASANYSQKESIRADAQEILGEDSKRHWLGQLLT